MHTVFVFEKCRGKNYEKAHERKQTTYQYSLSLLSQLRHRQRGRLRTLLRKNKCLVKYLLLSFSFVYTTSSSILEYFWRQKQKLCADEKMNHRMMASRIRGGGRDKKWKFLMVFAWGGKGCRVPIPFFSFFVLLKNHLQSLPTAKIRFAHSLSFKICIYKCSSWGDINTAEYASRRPQQPTNVNFEPITRGLKSDIFDWDQV